MVNPPPAVKPRMFKLLGLTLVPVGVLAVTVLTAGLVAEVRRVIIAHDPGGLEAVRATRASAVKSFFHEQRQEMSLLAQTTDVTSSLEEFTWAYQDVIRSAEELRAEAPIWKSELAAYLNGPAFSAGPATQEPATFLEQPLATLLLQALYLAKSHSLASHEVATAYRMAHTRWDAPLSRLATHVRAQDLLLADLHGNIVYSVRRNLDFGVNLRSGAHPTSPIRTVYETALTASDTSTVFHGDLAKPLFAQDAVSMCWGVPVFSGGVKTGVLLVRHSHKELEAMLSKPFGLGATGETYLVGSDLRFRSPSRFLGEGSVLRDSVNTELARRALAGETVTLKQVNYQGSTVLGAATPLDLAGVRWALIAETDYAEVMNPTRQLSYHIILSAGVFAVVSSSILLLLLNRIVLSPLAKLARNSHKLRVENAGGSLQGEGCREIQDLGETFNELVNTIRKDLADREDVALRMQETEARTRAILQLLPDGLVVVNQDGLIEMANEQVHAMCGYKPNELLGLRIETLVPAHPQLYGFFLMTGGPIVSPGRNGALLGFRKDGTSFPIEINMRPIQLGGSTDQLVACSLRDISQRVESEMELRKLSMAVDQSPSVVYITDKQGVIEYVNEQFTEVTGYSREEAIGHKPSLLKSGRVTLSVYKGLWATILSGKVWSGELLNRTKDGREFWVRLMVSPMQKDRGTITHFIAAAEDITKRKEAQQQLYRANFLADTALELTKAGPWHAPLDGSGTYFSSDRAVAIYGDPPRPDHRYLLSEEWLRNVEAADPKIAATVWTELQSAMAGNLRVYNAIYPYKRPTDGQIVWIHAVGRVIRDETGKPTDMYGVTQDITEAKLAAHELDAAKQAAEAANEAKTLFLATMSHEIRTPMNAVINMTQLTLDTELTARQRQYISAVSISARSLLALINDILDFSKIEAGKMELESRTFSLHRLLDEVTESFRGRVLEKGIEFIVFPDADIPDEIIGDSLRVRQILLNLIGNAFKFTEAGEILLRVKRVGFTEGEGEEPGRLTLEFFVKDSGIGIEKEKQNRLFSAFSQVDNSTSRKYGGSGLGLAISKRLVEMMNGRIWLESELGRGTAFFFTAEFGCASIETNPMSMPAGVEDLRVLIIDDLPNSREVLKSLVERFGMRSEVAASGAEGLAMLEQSNIQHKDSQPFDLVLLDWVMPGQDGLGVAAQLAQNPTLAPLPIIMVSAFISESEEARAAALGVKAFVHKPFTASSLFDAFAGLYGGPQTALLHRSALNEASLPDFEEFRNIPILMAEDNEANQYVALELLHSVGIELDIAENGQEALDKLAQCQDYACLLMDMQMPTMDGVTATREIRRRWPDLRLPIIALTANAMKSDEESCLSAGMDDFLSKPIDRIELFKTLRKWIDPNTPRRRPEFNAEKPVVEVAPVILPPAQPVIPSLPGIDVAKAQSRLGLPWESIMRILHSFAESQPQTLEELRAALQGKNWEPARRHAHSIAGSAGSLSAVELQARAKALELAIKGGTGDLEALHASMLEEMAVVLASIEQLIPTTATTTPAEVPVDTNSSPCDLTAFRLALAELEGQLEVGDVEGIQRCIENCRAAGVPAAQATQFARMAQFTGDFCFPEAGELLLSLRAAVVEC